MRLYCGIDLHSTNNYVAILDEVFDAVAGRRLPNDLEEVLKFLKAQDTTNSELAGQYMDALSAQTDVLHKLSAKYDDCEFCKSDE